MNNPEVAALRDAENNGLRQIFPENRTSQIFVNKM
jgi:hypothetical protein